MEDTSKQPNCDLKCFARKNIAKDLSLLHEAVKDLYLNFETFIKKQDSQEQSFFDPQSSPRFRNAKLPAEQPLVFPLSRDIYTYFYKLDSQLKKICESRNQTFEFGKRLVKTEQSQSSFVEDFEYSNSEVSLLKGKDLGCLECFKSQQVIQDLTEKTKNLEKQNEEYRVKTEHLEVKSKSLKELEGINNELMSQFEVLKDQIEDLNFQVEEKDEEINHRDECLEKAQTLILNLNKECEAYSESLEVSNQQLEKLKLKLDKTDSEKTTELQSKLKALRESSSTTIAIKDNQIKTLQSEVSKLEENCLDLTQRLNETLKKNQELLSFKESKKTTPNSEESLSEQKLILPKVTKPQKLEKPTFSMKELDSQLCELKIQQIKFKKDLCRIIEEETAFINENHEVISTLTKTCNINEFINLVDKKNQQIDLLSSQCYSLKNQMQTMKEFYRGEINTLRTLFSETLKKAESQLSNSQLKEISKYLVKCLESETLKFTSLSSRIKFIGDSYSELKAENNRLKEKLELNVDYYEKVLKEKNELHSELLSKVEHLKSLQSSTNYTERPQSSLGMHKHTQLLDEERPSSAIDFCKSPYDKSVYVQELENKLYLLKSHKHKHKRVSLKDVKGLVSAIKSLIQGNFPETYMNESLEKVFKDFRSWFNQKYHFSKFLNEALCILESSFKLRKHLEQLKELKTHLYETGCSPFILQQVLVYMKTLSSNQTDLVSCKLESIASNYKDLSQAVELVNNRITEMKHAASKSEMTSKVAQSVLGMVSKFFSDFLQSFKKHERSLKNLVKLTKCNN